MAKPVHQQLAISQKGFQKGIGNRIRTVLNQVVITSASNSTFKFPFDNRVKSISDSPKFNNYTSSMSHRFSAAFHNSNLVISNQIRPP